MNSSIVINVLEKLKIIIKQCDLDLCYSTYATEEELMNELDTYIYKLKHNDLSCKRDIKLLFAPTGNL